MRTTTDLPVDGCTVTTFDRFGDSRGSFNELYNETKYDESLKQDWKQVSFSSSGKHALRGLHCSPYGKFSTCVRGAFYDVIADFRDGSPTFGRWLKTVALSRSMAPIIMCRSRARVLMSYYSMGPVHRAIRLRVSPLYSPSTFASYPCRCLATSLLSGMSFS